MSDDAGIDLLSRALAGLGLSAAAPRLEAYLAEIEKFNPAYGLVKAADRGELIVKHLLDSLAPLTPLRERLPPAARIADAGSGAGLPGIPLAICLGECEFTLIERMGRRAGFLRNVCAALGLANVSVEECEAEKAAAGRFDALCFRAFRPLDKKLLDSLFRLCKPGAFLAAWKGKHDKARAEILACQSGGAGETFEAELLPVQVPCLEDQRCVVFLRQKN
ncbi:MAG: 16S rRNA (guanine(527)-N(7))-methyltransferase RsmG [Treponema sp.]|jgi:16S rRNA (guanine527-N7)-methyltransferase|nr:16S rRNA (guanine(527)-N(7))-methyltransferase RsmG [Treponema sp.]